MLWFALVSLEARKRSEPKDMVHAFSVWGEMWGNLYRT